MKNTIFLLFLQLVTLLTYSQGVQDSIVEIDTASAIQIRQFNDGFSDSYNGEEFNYTTKTGESQNLLARFINWIGQGLYNVFGIELSPQVLEILEYLIYLLLGLLVIYIVVKLLIKENFNSFFQKKAHAINDINFTEEHIETIDLNKLLKEALDSNNYRLAIRYQFLLTLQQLSKNDIIEWHFDKTNSDYLTEITEPQLKNKFKKVVYLYDYIWYGEQEIAIDKYEKSISDFETINNLLKQ
ncbi:hypothetical protein [Maribacter hydrothermalis]|uniref:hypothetical protein n=1 Tax=Maribacter hydrothermalis TaxID=1836467 RepID=UPI00083948AE|nr:hypothetical protein [Maribacter hydrothermalis]